jgi:hypothetical protein
MKHPSKHSTVKKERSDGASYGVHYISGILSPRVVRIGQLGGTLAPSRRPPLLDRPLPAAAGGGHPTADGGGGAPLPVSFS